MSAVARTPAERELGYAEAKAICRRAVIEEALIILRKNDYASMQKVRELLERAAASFGDSI